MSGPKVIDIEAVRRMQKRRSLSCLRALQLALREWQRLNADSNNTFLWDRFNTLFEAEEWETLSFEATRQREFYQSEVKRLRKAQADERAEELRLNHRIRQSAAQLISVLRPLSASSERDHLISQLENSKGTALQTSLDQALAFASANTARERSSHLRQLAAAFTDKRDALDDQKLPERTQDPQEQRLDRCWTLLGELAALGESPSLQRLQERAQQVALAEDQQRALLLDSLALEITTHLQEMRADQAAEYDLEMLLVEIEQLSVPEVQEWKNQLSLALTGSIPRENRESLIREARIWIEEAVAQETLLEQRAAILQALSTAGYEIREGMATAWADQGRIIIRKPTETRYGVELGAPSKGTAVQVRVVAFDNHSRDAQRDREVEETWCDEFQQARAELEQSGFATTLLHAEPVGAIPIKSVSLSETDLDRRREIEPPRPSLRSRPL